MKYFNTAAVCIPSKHYMVDISERINNIKKYVEEGKYFTINRARQYGKTTTLTALINALRKDYIVINLSFEGLTKANFSTEQNFVRAFCRLLKKNPAIYQSVPDEIKVKLNNYLSKDEDVLMDELFITFWEWCMISEKPLVLIIDEIDSTSNNQIFIDFLGLLRDGYIARDAQNIPAFQSVILAGVTDVKNLKGKIREDDDSKENSPWNIAADFNIDMSLSKEGIEGMLVEYESDHGIDIDTKYMSELIRDYTNGYPFLVSRICELIDREVSKKFKDLSSCWTRDGLDEAVKIILSEDSTLFKSMTTKLNNFPKLKEALKSLLMEGTKISWNPDQNDIVMLQMYGFIRNENNGVKIDNRIFETRLYNLFLSEEELDKNVFFREAEL